MNLKHKFIDYFFASLTFVSKISVLNYLAHPRLKVKRNIVYKFNNNDQYKLTLDLIELKHTTPKRPVLIHVHGGGFKDFSKDSHSHVALTLANMGFFVVNVNYRTIPKFSYPAPIEDLRDVLIWIRKNLNNYNVDLSEVYMIGESSGANLILATVLSQMNSHENISPKKIILSCGLFDVSTRFVRIDYSLVNERINLMRSRYIKASSTNLDYVDLLSYLEQATTLSVNFPDVLIQVGSCDVLYGQSVNLFNSLKKLNVNVQFKEYIGRGHALHAIPLAKDNVKIYTDMKEFLFNSSN